MDALALVVAAAALVAMLLWLNGNRLGRVLTGAGLAVDALAATFLAQRIDRGTIGLAGYLMFVLILLGIAVSTLSIDRGWHLSIRLALGIISCLIAIPIAAFLAALLAGGGL